MDDRALNRVVLQHVRDGLAVRGGTPLRVLEIGGGTGSMVRRCVDWELFSEAHYTLVDSDAESLAQLPTSHTTLDLQPVHSEIGAYLEETDQLFDLVIAHAVLDLIDLRQLLPLLWKRCSKEALYWFTINFDGESVFEPPLPEDEAIWAAYHASMDRRPGSSHAGRKLFGELRDSGASIHAAGSSDWVVHARTGHFPDDEAYFLHHIVHTVDQELRQAPPVEHPRFQSWIDRRHQQVHDSELIYIAHQLDFVGTAP